MTGTREFLSNVELYEGGRVTYGGGEHGNIIERGTLNVEGLPKLQNVLLVDGLKANLISISQLCDDNLHVKFDNTAPEAIRISDEQNIILEAETQSDVNVTDPRVVRISLHLLQSVGEVVGCRIQIQLLAPDFAATVLGCHLYVGTGWPTCLPDTVQAPPHTAVMPATTKAPIWKGLEEDWWRFLLPAVIMPMMMIHLILSRARKSPPRGNDNILPERRNYNPGPDTDSSSASKDRTRGGQQIKFSDDDIPSAPPLAGSYQKLSEISGKSATDITSRLAKSEVSADGIEPNKCRSSKSEVEACEMSARNKGSSSNSLPARYPTFHASGLGYWYSVLSYDACGSLCLHSWAKGCMEAPPFLESECSLLKEAFGGGTHEEGFFRYCGAGAYVKNKKTIGKIKVQVCKVRMGVEPPTGYSFTSIKSSSMVKLDSLQLRLSNMLSIVTAERKALKRNRIIPVMTVNGSLLPQKMAYIIVGTRRYLKEVPELIKIGFSAWRRTSASYEVVQGPSTGKVSEQIEQILTLVFENYKSLDESAPSGIADVFRPATGEAAPARSFTNFCMTFSRLKWSSKCADIFSGAFYSVQEDDTKWMKTLCLNIRNEILTDIEIHKQDLLPSFMDLPILSSSIYSTELYSRLRAFLVSCPPAGPSPPVVELVMATADFQRDLSLWDVR
ncbi:Unknown protein [Striga hermonthica]|uniref:Retrovirus-related Pol polyprotein from transposon TNT 1-94-like beta-barrel domain-containing protein n=1 Tax=Striga hermonthica TaxID=68872 RepID=A0A9N7R4G5_STRHE|nr:Unknown protein [Striga hermonthica]